MKLLIGGVFSFAMATALLFAGGMYPFQSPSSVVAPVESPALPEPTIEIGITKLSEEEELYWPSFCELYRWAPEDYFEDSKAIEICLAIQSRDRSKLQALIRQGYDLNTPGRAGVTVLFWAFFDDNLEAFKILLDAGADPDQKLTDFIRFDLRPPLNYGDSVIFTCLKEHYHDFFLAAFAHTKNPQQTDNTGETLPLAYALPGSSLDQRVIDSLVEAGVDLNVTDRYGSTAALRVLGWYHPRFCLALLKAGIDPAIADKEGRTVSSHLNNMLASPSKRNKYGDQLEELRDWLDAHAAQGDAESSSPEDDAVTGSVSDDPS